jgi:predicted RNase H-like HicB family nuclease
MKREGGLDIQFTLLYWKDKDWYVGKLKEVPGIFSQGRTLKELKENIFDAYKLVMSEEETTLPRAIRERAKEIRVTG